MAAILNGALAASAFVTAHWLALGVTAGALVAAVVLYRFLVNTFGPNDLTGNGIAVGGAKCFDNRSLTLMLEQLNASLQAFNVVSQNVVQNLGAFQAESSTNVTRALRGALKLSPETSSGKAANTAGSASKAKLEAETKTGGEIEDASPSLKEKPSADSVPGAHASSPSALKPAIGISAGDALTEQLNLAHQIFNLRILNERALSDRLYNDQPRLQVVLGFQVSINPPNGMEDCAAVSEIGLRMQGSDQPISVVALIPQEKTYNAATLSSKADSLDGSIVSVVVSAGASGGRQTKNLYLHRDADTVAFERHPGWKSGAFWPEKEKAPQFPTVFGWEFRPVLGRRTVSPGTRQMLAVVALPFADDQIPALLQIQTRTYWRRYNRRRQTTSLRWAWWPLTYPGARQIEAETITIQVPPTSQVQRALQPAVEKIDWVDAGDGTAVVVIEGYNFFSGTEVVIGGRSHRGPERGLILKSDRVLEVRTTVAALSEGDVLLSGRFGPSTSLRLNPEKLPAPAILIASASMYLAAGGIRSLVLVVRAADNPKNGLLLCDNLKNLPPPLIYVNGRPVPKPYDYEDCRWRDLEQNDAVCVRAWVPAGFVEGGNPVVLFKIPFCGPDWVARSVIAAGELLLARLGGDKECALVIRSPGFDFPDDYIATLDRNYVLGSNEFMKLDSRHLQLSLPADLLGRYTRLVLRSKSADAGYILDIPGEDTKPAAIPALDPEKGSPMVVKGRSAIVDWEGTGLDVVTEVKLGTHTPPFEVYAKGTRLRVFLEATHTAAEGKLELVFRPKTGNPLHASLFVIEANRDFSPRLANQQATPPSGC